MDLITIALAKKYAGEGGEWRPSTMTIGENGHWYIDDVDTGIEAVTGEELEIEEFFPQE